jgi:predicted amidophosphoribosyltransferase
MLGVIIFLLVVAVMLKWMYNLLSWLFSPPQYICPYCKNPLNHGANVCGYCGRKCNLPPKNTFFLFRFFGWCWKRIRSKKK